MRTWLIRGLTLGVIHALVQTILAAFSAANPNSVTVLRAVALGVLIGVAFLWGAVDSWRGHAEYGLAAAWLKSALLAGPVAGVLGVIGQGVFVDNTGIESLGVAITGGAAFTALLVVVPSIVGLGVGRLVGQRDDVSQRSASK